MFHAPDENRTELIPDVQGESVAADPGRHPQATGLRLEMERLRTPNAAGDRIYDQQGTSDVGGGRHTKHTGIHPRISSIPTRSVRKDARSEVELVKQFRIPDGTWARQA